jgi:glycosyltransferase involved in cell wall biosynthesis
MRGFWPEERVEGGIWGRHSLLFHAAKFFERKFFAAADHIIVLTNAAKQILEQRHHIRKPISIIPTCADTVLFAPRPKDKLLIKKLHLQDRFILVYTGSIGTWYRFRDMLDFFLTVKYHMPSAHFLLLVNDISAAKAQLMQHPISLLDYTIQSITWKDMPRWLSIADVAIFFITPTFSKQGSFPTKMAESLAMGIPIITNSGMRDISAFLEKQNVGIVIKNFHPSSYVRAVAELQRLLKETGLKKRCRTAAEKHLSVSIGIKRYADIYRGLL